MSHVALEMSESSDTTLSDPVSSKLQEEEAVPISGHRSRSSCPNPLEANQAESGSPVRKWYFKQNPAFSSAPRNELSALTNKQFLSTFEPQPAVKIDASNTFASWSLEMDNVTAGRYDIVLGISTAQLDLHRIESFTFYQTSYGSAVGVEIISKRHLRLLSMSCSGISRWKLHYQLQRLNDADDDEDDNVRGMILEIRTEVDEESPSGIPVGYIELEFMEIHPCHAKNILHDPYLRTHQPFLWSIDADVMDDCTDKVLPYQPKKVLRFDISGDGMHAVTLSGTSSHLCIDLWDLHQPSAPVGSTGAAAVEGVMNREPAPFHPGHYAGIRIPMKGYQERLRHRTLDIFASWNASQIALIDATDDRSPKAIPDFQSVFAVYRHLESNRASSESSPTKAILYPSKDYQHCDLFKDFHGYGKFYIDTTEDPMIKNELFIACDGWSVQLYNAFGRWELMRKITLVQPYDDILNLPDTEFVVDGLRGKYFVWTDHHEGLVSIWDITLGSLITPIRLPFDTETIKRTRSCLSSDGSIVAFYRGSEYATYKTATGEQIGYYRVPEHCGHIFNLHFLKGGTQIMFESKLENGPNSRTFGVIMETVSMNPLSRFAVSGICSARDSFKEQDDRNIYSRHGSKLEMVSLEERINKENSRPESTCDDKCKENLRPLSQHKTAFTAPSGLHFSVKIYQAAGRMLGQGREPLSGVVVTMSTDTQSRMFTIPADVLHNKQLVDYEWAVFLEDTERLVVATECRLMIWDLPSTIQGDISLILPLWVGGETYSPVNGKENWQTCPHEEVFAPRYIRDEEDGRRHEKILCLSTKINCCVTNYLSLLVGIGALRDIFLLADKPCQDEILKYVARHINLYMAPSYPELSVLLFTCHQWDPKSHLSYERFVTAILASPFGRWIPKQDMDEDTNPIAILIEKAKTEPRAMGLAKVFIDYCIRQARLEKSPHFLLPVLQCLHSLVDKKQLHSELALTTLRSLAYAPVNDRSFIIGRHTIAHPPELRLKFWKSNIRPLYKCDDPVLQLVHTPNVHNPQNDNFTRSLFVADFRMLWHVKDSNPRLLSKTSPIQPGKWTSWLRILFYTIVHKCKLKSNIAVECHDFALEPLDNPALAALIEYKWNTIGFKYWLLRFLCQCCYYALVLVAVFIQVYGPNRRPLVGVFFAIAAGSLIFLWLELIQAFKGWKRYFASIYNIVDLITFGFTMAASIVQLVVMLSSPEPLLADGAGQIERTPEGTGNGLLSFSVLFISLHFLFELRVSKNVSHYVTIIIMIISQIRVFFFIFFGGILAFTTAILHLLHACSFESCKDLGLSFPRHFYYAISSTYLFMGGRYDPISDILNDQEHPNWPFHMMMIIYFFFTVILMLNVLIGKH
ncbi:hypothetical protein BC939DRAFT_446141 [Gamsiella multidivaricata]|uniref:uncharacterized protein n=1 Tax=Gamsiella multidivaricata TaxID=101098 RepID=UPI00221E9031|nr:uncharacterized protein BC939DRAFT_446141 [Gamsiella multidivaricata]KAI7826895.1 hypothetical protein BC939DRAFT_446141 [Gamsiella multidivaricata]